MENKAKRVPPVGIGVFSFQHRRALLTLFNPASARFRVEEGIHRARSEQTTRTGGDICVKEGGGEGTLSQFIFLQSFKLTKS